MLNKIDTTLGAGLIMVAMTLGCVSAEDEANMTKKMELETARAEIMLTHAKDCDELQSKLVAFGEKNKESLKSLDAWWGGLGDGPKDKLIEKHREAWNMQSGAMIAAGGCADAIKAGMKAGM